MHIFNLLPTRTFLSIALLGIFIIMGCSNPASSDNEDHLHPEGIVFQINDGEEILRIEDGEFVSNNTSLEVGSGDETPLIEIFFLDHDGDPFHPEDDHYSLKWDKIDTSIAEIEQHEEDGKWSFYLIGQNQGETEIRFRMWHEDGGHSDFDTPAIPVIVN